MANVGKVWNGTAWVDLGSTATFQSAGTATVGVVQLTDSTSSTSTTTAATPNSVKSAYDLAGTAIPKNTVTAAGDILYASGSATVTRLGIGTANQVLSVSGTVPAWTTPSSGGGLTVLGTATPSGATSVSFSSIPTTYKHLVVRWFGVYMSANTGFFAVRVNSNSGAVYSSLQTRTEGNAFDWTWTTGGTYYGKNDASCSIIPRVTDNNSAYPKQGYGELTIYDYASTALSLRHMQSLSYGYYVSADVPIVVQTVGGYTASGTAITSIQFERQSGSETITGTFYLYGVS